MHVIGADVDRSQPISAIGTNLANSLFNYGSLSAVQLEWGVFQLTEFGSLQTRISRDTRSAILVLFAINRAACVTMQPGTISPKRDEISEREFVIVKVSDHEEWLASRYYEDEQ